MHLTTQYTNFITAAQSLEKLGLEIGPSGNLSFRSLDNRILITPSGANFGEINKDLLSTYALDTLADTGPKPSSDLQAHVELYAIRPDVKAVVHTHAHYIVLLAMLGLDIHVYNTMHADYFGRAIKCVPFANHRQHGYGKAADFAVGRVFLLEKHGGLILFNHQDPQKIAADMQVFAEIAQLYYQYLLGSEVLAHERNPIPDDDLALIHDYYSTEYGTKNRG